MENKSNRINWSKKRWRKQLIEQRKFLWRDDSIEMYAKWIGMKPGMNVVDVGCGFGYLGWTYWKYFGENGKYIGIDKSKKLISKAKDISKEWAKKGSAEFRVADAYCLPLQDNSADIVMSQTLLMHLDNPKKALKEMKRVCKPGGIIMCMEPDNLSSCMKIGFNSITELPVDEEILQHKIKFCWIKGKKKLGRSDWRMGVKLPKLMTELDLDEIDMRTNDLVNFINPPYQTPLQKKSINKMKENIFEKKDSKERKYFRKRFKEEALAGGASKYLLSKYFKLIKKLKNRYKNEFLDQIESNDFYSFYGGSFFYICIGKKSL